MATRWAAWPRGLRRLVGGVVAIVFVLAIAWLLFVPAADWLAHHDVGSLKGPPLQAARDAARGRLLTLGAGLLAAGALWFTARNFTLSREGQVTDRYTKAIEQLGSDKLDVRIGGIYALERIAHDSARDHSTVMEVLAAFAREHSHEAGSGANVRPDVQAAIVVIGRRNPSQDKGPPVDLSLAHLRSAGLGSAHLASALLGGANLLGANPSDADLTDADLVSANLSYAMLVKTKLANAHLRRTNLVHLLSFRADFTGANLADANLTDARLEDAHLDAAVLMDAILVDANLADASLSNADLTRADLTDANLSNVNLTGANLADANLTRAVFTGVRWPEGTPVPEGWTLDARSGRLTRVNGV